ncbi:MAG: bifunctional helix-turn-helix transcriptional regulator/GNAT family N-acetyltransferase [Acidobacteriota bacterium]
MNESVSSLRESSRRVVRELGFLRPNFGDPPLAHSQCHALLEIDRHGSLSLTELSRILRLDKSTASRLLAELQRKRWIRQTAPAGKRTRPVTLTASGKRRLNSIDAFADDQVEQALARLSAGEIETVLGGMELYARALTRSAAIRSLSIRPIRRSDNSQMEAIIRTVMPEYGAVGEGYSINDPEVSGMFEAYRAERAAFFVLARGSEVFGGGGIAPLAGAGESVCELRKMYFVREIRGLGFGQRMLEHCLQAARERGFRTCYLETLGRMNEARDLYVKNGFRPRTGPLGDTGHSKCDAWYSRAL